MYVVHAADIMTVESPIHVLHEASGQKHVHFKVNSGPTMVLCDDPV